MIETFKQGLLITGVGMGLVFVMIFLLWGIMALLVWLTNPREKASDEPDADEAVELEPAALDVPAAQTVDDDEGQRLAAALAVAYALSRPSAQSFAPGVQTPQGSNWLSIGRAQQLLSNKRGRN